VTVQRSVASDAATPAKLFRSSQRLDRLHALPYHSQSTHCVLSHAPGAGASCRRSTPRHHVAQPEPCHSTSSGEALHTTSWLSTTPTTPRHLSTRDTYNCSECPSAFVTRAEAQTHLRSEHFGKGNVCLIPPSAEKSRRSARLHSVTRKSRHVTEAGRVGTRDRRRESCHGRC